MQRLFRQILGANGLCVCAVFALVAFPFVSQAPGQSWHNASNPFDVSGDDFLGVDDFHPLISELSAPTITVNGLPTVASPPPFLDVNNSDTFSPIDALLLINEHNDNGTFSAGIPDDDVRIDGPAMISFQFEDSMGNTINQASIGDSFFMRATLNDLRDVPLDIYAAYVDILFDRTLVENSFNVDFGQNSFFDQAGELTDFGVDEVGTVLTRGLALADSYSDGRNFFRAELTAAAEGTFEVTGDDGYVLMLGILDAIAPTYNSATLTIVPEPGSAAMLLFATALVLCRRRKK